MKKLTAFLLSLCLLVPILPARAAETPPAWATEAYEALKRRNILLLSDYKTSGAIKRHEFANLLVSLLAGAIPETTLQQFHMVEQNYFSDYPYSSIRKAAGYGIIEGTIEADGKRYSHPDDPLTREQGAKIVCSLLDFVSNELEYPVTSTGSPAVYADAAAISSWALPFTQRIAAYGLMKGDDQGNFNPLGNLDWPSAMVMAQRILALLDEASLRDFSGLPLQSNFSWSGNFGITSHPLAWDQKGWDKSHYIIDNADGTVSGLVVSDAGQANIYVERFNSDGSLVESKTLERELPNFGTFFDSGEHFYLAFGQRNNNKDDNQEVWRIVQYDRDWNRLGSVSVNGRDSYTTIPFDTAVARMAVSEDGKTVALHTTRLRYDGHQSNITFTMNTFPFSIQEVMGEEFPKNHVSHSFGQFVQYDGEKMVTVDHGDGFPRSFVFQDGSRRVNLLKIYGKSGDNRTNAIGSGFEVSDDGYLFLGCSDPQDGSQGQPWNVFLAYLGKSGKDVKLTWLTQSEDSIDCARLVKLDGDTFVAMWAQGGDIHWLKLNGLGSVVSEEQILSGAVMPPTDPVVIGGDICWIQASAHPQYRGKALLYRIEVD